MKVVEHAIYEKLKAFAGGRVYALRAPQNVTAPFVVFQRVDSGRWRSINNPSGIAQARIQIDIYATEYYSAKQLAAEIEKSIDGFHGTVYYGSSSPQEFITIHGISLQSDADIADQTDEPFLYRNLNEYLVTYKQED